MRGVRLIASTCAALLVLAFGCAQAQAVGGPANWMYEPTSFVEVRLELPPASIASLESKPKKYVEGTFSMAETNGTPGSAGAFSAPLKVGIELKGSIGSLVSVHQKAAFKVKFDKYVEGQRFLGLEKLTLNNMIQDPSMIHEATTYEAFHRMGVPAPHVGYAYLTVNGESYGLHLNIEAQDAQSLENAFGTKFGPPQHLYEGEYGSDVTNEPLPLETKKKKWEGLEVSEGDEEHKGDLEALVAAVEASSPAFAQRVGPFADLTEMAKNWMVEKYVGNWDGYAGYAPDEYHPNNYYLYSDASGVFQMMPWGTDQTWQSNNHLSFASGGGILFTDCLADTAGCRQTYLAAGREALSRLDAKSMDTVARCVAAAVLPWQEFEVATSEQEKLPKPSASPEENLERAEDEVTATRDFIASRPAELAEFLGEPTPTPASGEPPCPPLRPIGGFVKPKPPLAPETAPPGGATLPAPTAGNAPLHWPRAAILRRSEDRIVLRLVAPGPGRLRVAGTYGKAGDTACRGATYVKAAGPTTVACDFTGRFASLLQRRWRRVRLHARFVPEAGSVEAIARSLELRRWPTHPSSS